MNETTRKYYVAKGEEFEKASNYEDALSSYMEAFSVKECTAEDNPDFFKPGFIEDRIAFLAYRLGEFRIALTYGAKAYRANSSDDRMANNLPFYTDAILYVNPKERLDKYIDDYLIENYSEDCTVLDIGPMDGRWYNSLHNHFKHMDAVEAFEPYVEHYHLREKYDNVFISDVRTFDFDYYDIIILGDVLEHMPIKDAQALLERLTPRCKQIIIVIPFEYPQDEYDDNEYQIHHQEDLTDEIFHERYPGFSLLIKDEVRGAYVKEGSKTEEKTLTALDKYPKTFQTGLVYFNNGSYSKAVGVFENSLEIMTDEEKARMLYYSGLCYSNMGSTLEALKDFTAAVETLPSYKDAYYEIFKILENLQFWGDLEYYLKKALEHSRETNNIDSGKQIDWKNLLLIQLTLALSKQKKIFEAYGYAALAVDSVTSSEERKRIAQYNFDELKKELWSTLQI